MVNNAKEALETTLNSNARKERYVLEGLKSITEAAELGKFEKWISAPNIEPNSLKDFEKIFKDKGFTIQGRQGSEICIGWHETF